MRGLRDFAVFFEVLRLFSFDVSVAMGRASLVAVEKNRRCHATSGKRGTSRVLEL